MSEQLQQGRRVLIVDDNCDAATSMAYLLSSAGYRVATAFSGHAALELLERFDPEVCILDINMPLMSGYELAKRIRERITAHPIMLATLTAYSDGKHLDQAVGAGFDLHFTKPAELEDLVDQIETFLASNDRTEAH